MKQLLGFGLCTLVFVRLPRVDSITGNGSKTKGLRPKAKDDLRESNSDVAFTKASSRKREFVA